MGSQSQDYTPGASTPEPGAPVEPGSPKDPGGPGDPVDPPQPEVVPSSTPDGPQVIPVPEPEPLPGQQSAGSATS